MIEKTSNIVSINTDAPFECFIFARSKNRAYCRSSSLSDLSPTDVSPALNLVCAELSLRDRRDRLLDIFPAEKSRSAVGLLEEGVDPGEHGLQSEKTASDGGDDLKGKQRGELRQNRPILISQTELLKIRQPDFEF